MTTFHDETAFVGAWRDGVTLAGEHYFGNAQSTATAASKVDLSPDLDRINHDIEALSSGEAVFRAVLVRFYSGAAGAELLGQAAACSLHDAAAELDYRRRPIPADLRVAIRVGG